MPESIVPRIHFSPESLQLLNALLAFIMFGVALDLKLADFRRILMEPKRVLIGWMAQFLGLPLFTFLMIYTLKPPAGIALGMMLVAVCPGGNYSNYMVHLAGGKTALSVSLTALATLSAVWMTPFNLGWSMRFLENTTPHVQLDGFDMIQTLFILIILPMAMGLTIHHLFPLWRQRIKKPIQILSMILFALFLLMAFYANKEVFLATWHQVMGWVFLHNLLALLLGYGWARLWLKEANDHFTISIESGIQNSGLGLILIFQFFDGQADMALVAAFWGIWHLISGLSFALLWKRFHHHLYPSTGRKGS